MHKLELYFHTIKYLRLSQIYHQMTKRMGLRCAIGHPVIEERQDIHFICSVPELDFDDAFLSRFSVAEIMHDRMTFLHTTQDIVYGQEWAYDAQTALWNFNLHYFEFLFPLLKKYLETGDNQYLLKAVDMMLRWIDDHPVSSKRYGWASYTISLRLTHWLSFLSYVYDAIDEPARQKIIASIYHQYRYLSKHLEKDKLANHYFENLKALTLCAIFFQDKAMLAHVLPVFEKECAEEILVDGMHYELSPMYHNLILEGLLRVCAALREAGCYSEQIESYLQPMVNAAWSMQGSLQRLPLFNDTGNNVAKSLEALMTAAKHYDDFELHKTQLSSAGYYILKRDDWKLIIDAGDPGPSYNAGHAHCDAMSFELYYRGKPVIVNCGTYAYQTELRSFFRSTAAHNTIRINGVEQSLCWGGFRMAQRSHTRVVSLTEDTIVMEMVDQKKQKAIRTITFGDQLIIEDRTDDGRMEGYLHTLFQIPIHYDCEQQEIVTHSYAPDYGEISDINAMYYQGNKQMKVIIQLDEAGKMIS